MPRRGHFRHRRDHRWARRSESDDDEIPVENLRVKMDVPKWMFLASFIYVIGFPIISPCVLRMEPMIFWQYIEKNEFYYTYNTHFVFWLIMGVMGMTLKKTVDSAETDTTKLSFADQVSLLSFILSFVSLSWSLLIVIFQFLLVKDIPSLQFSTLKCYSTIGANSTA